MSSDLSNINHWADEQLVIFNALKTDSLIISRKINPPKHPPVSFQGHSLKNDNQHKHLGVTLDSNLKQADHINEIVAKSGKLIRIIKSLKLKRLKFTLDLLTLKTIYTSFIRQVLEYGNPVWSGCTVLEAQKLESVQLNAARTETWVMHGTSNVKLYEELGQNTLAKRRDLF